METSRYGCGPAAHNAQFSLNNGDIGSAAAWHISFWPSYCPTNDLATEFSSIDKQKPPFTADDCHRSAKHRLPGVVDLDRPRTLLGAGKG